MRQPVAIQRQDSDTDLSALWPVSLSIISCEFVCVLIKQKTAVSPIGKTNEAFQVIRNNPNVYACGFAIAVHDIDQNVQHNLGLFLSRPKR